MALAGGTASFAAECSTEAAQDKKMYTAKRTNIRSCASRYCDRLATLPPGQTVFAYREADGWYAVNVRALNLTGYIYKPLLTKTCVPGEELVRGDMARADIVSTLMSRSQSRYNGSCPCPHNVDRSGRRCGGRSAYSRPGGASPLCYSSDVTAEMIRSFQSDRKR